MRNVFALGLWVISACIGDGRDRDRSDFMEHVSCESILEMQQACARARETDVCCEGARPSCNEGVVPDCAEFEQ